MIKLFSAFTEEIDDVVFAVNDILNQLDIVNSLKKNSVGILHCYHEFIDSGVVEALSGKLPFDIIGITVPYICVPGRASSMGLMLNVLTDDEAEFVTGISKPLDKGGGNLSQAVEEMCGEIKAKNNEKPVMIMAYAPFLHVLNINADEFVDDISKAFPNTPVFGGFSFSEEIDFSKCFVLYNGKSYENTACVITISGDVSPSFLTIAVPEQNILGELATATKSTGNILHEINGMSVVDYVISIGLIDNKDDLEKIYSTPIIAMLEDGSKIVRVCIGGDGQGGAVMGGHVPVGAKIGFTILELNDTISTSGEIAKKTVEILDGRSVIVYTCMARLEFLSANQRELEAKSICDIIDGSADYYLAYTGGEIFPYLLPNNEYVNHLQNFSIVVCVL